MRFGPASFLYDANGNLTSDGGINLAYENENRLVSASGAKTAALSYDPMGRLAQTSGGAPGVTQFLYDGDELVAEYSSSGAAFFVQAASGVPIATSQCHLTLLSCVQVGTMVHLEAWRSLTDATDA